MFWEQKVHFASATDIGFRRQNNQDSFTVHLSETRQEWLRYGHLFVVADGMGGHAVGELASKLAVDTLPHTFTKTTHLNTADALRKAIETTNHVIYERGNLNREFDQMGTTCTTLSLGPQGAIIGHVGDSRAYRIRNGKIEQLSFDHSLQWELIRQGHLTPEEVYATQPRNVITRSLGPEAEVEVDIEGPYPVEPGDTFVLCSDGLTGHVSDQEIGIIAGSMSPNEACRFLVQLANLRGGSDNITIIICRAGEIPPNATPIAEEEYIAIEIDKRDEALWSMLIPVLGCVAAAGFVLGVIVALLSNQLAGIVLTVLSTLLGGIVLWKWFRGDVPLLKKSENKTSQPYRTANAKLTHDFLEQMVHLEREIREAAEEESWEYDRAKHEAAMKIIKKANEEKHAVRLLQGTAAAIAALMTGLHQLRKSHDTATRWKK